LPATSQGKSPGRRNISHQAKNSGWNGHFCAKNRRLFIAVPAIDLHNYHVDREIVKLVPRELAQQHEVFPLDRMGRQLVVGMVCPLDAKTIEKLETTTSLRIRAFVCHKGDLAAMLRKYYPSEEEPDDEAALEVGGEEPLGPQTFVAASMRLKYVVDMVQKIDSLPSLPAAVRQCQEAMSNPDISPRELAEIVSKDPVVAANLLHVVNSAAFGLAQRVDSVALAVSLLGIRETCMIVMALAVPQVLKVPDTFDYERYRRDSVYCATVCKAIAEAGRKGHPASYFTAGLLHDIGRVVLAVVATWRYAKIEPGLNGRELVAAEEEALGIGHTEVGSLLAEKWEFPPELAQPIRFHHAPEAAEESREVVEAVALGARMLDAWGRDAAELEALVDSHGELIARLGLDRETALDIARAADAAVEARM